MGRSIAAVPASVCFMEGGDGGDKSGAALGDNQKDDGEDHSRGHRAHLEMADIPAGHDLCDKEVIHVEEGVQRQGEEEEGASLLPVRAVVVPQHEAGQSRQDRDAQQVVQGCNLQQEGEQQQDRDHGDLQVVDQGLQDGRAASSRRWSVFQPPATQSATSSLRCGF